MQVYFTSDFHSSFSSGLEALELLLTVKRRGAKIVDSGDFLSESAFSAFAGHESALKLMEVLFDAVCPGNHGFAETCRLLNATCCNLYCGEELVCRSKIEVSNGDESLVFIGLLGEEAFGAIPLSERKGFKLEEPKNALSKALAKHHASTKIILLSHCGFALDEVLASEFPNLTAIISGHCHSIRYVSRVGSVPVIKAPELGVGVGFLKISESGVVTELGIQTSFSQYAPSSNISQICDLKQDISRFREWSGRSVGGHRNEFYLNTARRSYYLDMLVRAIASKLTIPFVTNTFVFREIPQRSVISNRDLLDFIPFDNRLVMLEGQDLVHFLAKLQQFQNISYSHSCPCDHIMTTDYLYEAILERPFTGTRREKLRDAVKKVIAS